jgi:hypothetical protein
VLLVLLLPLLLLLPVQQLLLQHLFVGHRSW